MAWRRYIKPDSTECPRGRRPFHVILTAQASVYQEWQTKIMHYHFQKVQRNSPCTEMTGFTRLLASSGAQPDGLMDSMPTIVVEQATHDKTRGFQVINRPWSMNEMLKTDEWRKRVTEDYVFIAETDHLVLRDIPNRATPELNVAFFFPYMSPVPDEQARVVKRYFNGNHLSVQPVGPSPALMHVNSLKKLTPLWLDLSVKLKADRSADAAFGWVLEMWGYSLACANLGIKHFVWQQLQIEPSSTWHQNVSAEDPYIYHYTFGVEYSLDGVPVVGSVGEWSLDKRHYFGGYPPKNLEPPPKCAQECAYVWWRMFNEATAALGDQWNGRQLGGTRSFARNSASQVPEGAFADALVAAGPWVINGQKPIIFYARGRLSTPWGLGSWSIERDNEVMLDMCGIFSITFDSVDAPTSFTGSRKRSGLMASDAPVRGSLDPSVTRPPKWDEETASHPAVRRVLGKGPWAWAGITPMAFLGDGLLLSPWGPGTYSPVQGSQDQLIVNFVGAKHHVVVDECNKFTSTRESDGAKVDGWVQLGMRAHSCKL